MNSYEKFIVSPDRLSDVMCAILQQEIPETFNREFLTAAGIDEPNNTLYISLFQNLGLVDEDEHPTRTYLSFHRSEEDARKVIARQMRNQTYTAVFNGNEKPWLLPDEEVRELFQDLMGEKKSATFVRLVTRTFLALADFADWKQTEPEIPETREDSAVAEVRQVPEELAETTPLDRAISPHEEFILELMNDRTHTYAYHSFASVRNGEDNESAHPNRNGKQHASAHHKQNGVEHASAHHEQNGNGTADLVSSMQEKNSATQKSEMPDIELQDNGITESGKHVNGVHDNGIDDNSMVENSALISGSPQSNHPLQADESNGDSGHPQDQQTLFIKAMIRRAVLLKQMERLNEAVVAFDQIIRYADRRHSQIDHRKVISAYYNKAQLLERMEQQEEALVIYEQMIRCFASSN